MNQYLLTNIRRTRAAEPTNNYAIIDAPSVYNFNRLLPLSEQTKTQHERMPAYCTFINSSRYNLSTFIHFNDILLDIKGQTDQDRQHSKISTYAYRHHDLSLHRRRININYVVEKH